MLRALLTRLRWPLLGGAAAALVLVGVSVAGSGVGATLNLGVANSVDAQTTLTGNPAGNPLFRFTGTGTAATIRVDAGSGPAINGISTSNTGQFGQSTTGTGVVGAHIDSTGPSAGVEGRTASTGVNAVGVLGRTTSASADSTSAGVKGFNAGTGAGVDGIGGVAGVRAALNSDFAPASSAAVEALVSGHGQGLHVHPGGLFFGDAVGILVERLIPALVVTGGSPQATQSTGLIEATNANRFGRAIVGTADSDSGVGVQGVADNVSGVGILGRSTSGLAGRFEGDVHVTGKVTRAYTSGTANQAAPVAYGVIASGGSVTSTATTPNVTSTFDSVNDRYMITIANESYDINRFATTVTPIATTPRIAVTQSSGGKLLVRIFDLTGATVQASFDFAVYKP
jgi:hypothetical protein